MATINDWNKYITVVHELALVEDDLRWVLDHEADSARTDLAEQILYERF